MLRLITDFDGPIMDVSDRYYLVYQLCLEKIANKNQSICQLSKEQFWQLKRAKVPEKEIARLSGLNPEQAAEFAHIRHNTVHQIPYLVHDKLVPGALETLELIKKNSAIDLIVMTMRRQQELEVALEKYDLWEFFPPNRRYCLSNDYVKTGDVKDKPLLMAKALTELPPVEDVWMVGDTEADIVAAKSHNVKVIGVLSGIRDKGSLAKHKPDYIVDNLVAAVNLISSHHQLPIG